MKSNYEYIAGLTFPYSENFDLTSNGELIAYAYTKDTNTIFNIFDLKL